VANAMTPGATALVADVSEDRIAFIDEQMSRLDGVVLRQWQSELPEMRLAAEAAARKTELEQLVAERQDAAPARKEVIALRIEKAEAKLKRIADEAKEKLEQLDASTEERLETLERQLESAGPNARLSIERRIEETRKQRDRRAALLKQTIEVAEAALAACRRRRRHGIPGRGASRSPTSVRRTASSARRSSNHPISEKSVSDTFS